MGAALLRLSVYFRPLLLFVMQTGLFIVLDKWIFPNINETIANIAIKFGVSDEVATDIAANEVLAFLESAGVTVATMRSRMPLRLADRLGFSTKGYTKRSLPKEVEAKVKVAKTGQTKSATPSAEQIEEIATGTAIAKGLLSQRVKDVLTVISFVVGLPTGVLYMIAQYIDYGAWNGSAYQGTFQPLLALIGLKADQQTVSPRTVSKEVFDKVYTALKLQGAETINNPYTGKTEAFSQTTFSAIVDKTASQIFIETGSVSAKQLLGAVLPLTNLKKPGTAPTPAGTTSTTAQSAVTSRAVPAQIKVFTGVVGGGTLGLPQEFTARPDDMIQDVDELKAAAKNNLASFVGALPGKFYYELGIVSSVKTRGGFSQKGEAVRVISSYTTKGVPRYKTVYHKFAVLKLGVTDENGRTVKLATINLGPVNAVDFQPTAVQLEQVEAAITPELFTSDITEIQQIISPQSIVVSSETPLAPAQSESSQAIGSPLPIASTASGGVAPTTEQLSARLNPQAFTIQVPSAGLFRAVGDYGTTLFLGGAPGQAKSFSISDLGKEAILARSGRETDAYGSYKAFVGMNSGSFAAAGVEALRAQYGIDYNALPQVNIGDYVQSQNFKYGATLPPTGFGFVAAPLSDFLNAQVATLTAQQMNTGTNILAASERTTANAAALAATSLSVFYAAIGRIMPDTAARAVIYAGAGLGAQSTYIGTAEQNARLLAWSKAQLK